ncbi:methionyl-tRNA formyltransferase [Pseudoalteromonas luteoviolacea]|uniref:Methionyl-tRNA formyltransferase n=1 Tax=Pseudoalteromonas luteoviolacea S4054 TaxID=1129367 RepID=A0A0F6AF19_9GAMM|nr:formyltransferase family protein [Pseudoalteromonas luteoviolacea]AOT09701.1 hypothetical protein S4054249_18565 [Pseudoalteromonas luteoviolacea]AOT14614.1 hypothetical protein S40542_18535 [Pseudoalteromonas luteoviolacea]AOT19528.1 hypothetical protein S4054_18540 [Pseudoalteromonas luteoviolacea]KKE83969.1 hypothetical protein N479_11190 [Pseudoalteromonas luteoviolacea S4054]KZN77363.1 hypothetical protein N481_04730 [Pseudoalteromonas luteoviolacea S4047-1]
MSVVVIGCLEETLDTLNCLYAKGGKVDALITISEDTAKAAGTTNWVCLEAFSKMHDIPLLYAEQYSMKNERDYALVEGLKPEAIIVLGWQRLIPENIIQLSTCGCIGFHGSANFLPWGRGRSPINWSIIEGRNRFILHMFLITPGIDDGDIVGFEIYDITPHDTCRSVYYKTAMAQANLIAQFLPQLRAGTCPVYPQVGEEYHYPKRTPEDGKIDWNQPAEDICRLVRAVTEPYPGAYTLFGESKIMIWEAQDFGDNLMSAKAKPGEVIFVSSNMQKEVAVKCRGGAVLLTKYDTDLDLKIGDIING